MAADEQRARDDRKQSSARASDLDASDVTRLRHQMQQMAGHMPADERGKFKQLLADTELVSDYAARREEIESACHALEAHRAEFEKLANDDQAFIERARRLFAEKPFAPLRFHAADIQRAFSSIGYPSRIGVDEGTRQILRQAILYLAGERERHSLAMRLLLLLPDHVAAGRPLDAWVIQDCAFLTMDSPKESNPFLFEMFWHGLIEWEQRRDADDASLLREMGVDVEKLRGMKLEEIDDWFATQMADPHKVQQMESLLNAHPELRAVAEADCWAMERDSARLLERADARSLLLSPDEVQPWLPVFERRLQAESHTFTSLVPGREPDEATMKVFGDLVISVSRDMARAIFTPTRIEQLKAQLQDYRRKLYAADEKLAANQAQGALMVFQRESDPAENYFVISLCYASLRSLLNPVGTESA